MEEEQKRRRGIGEGVRGGRNHKGHRQPPGENNFLVRLLRDSQLSVSVIVKEMPFVIVLRDAGFVLTIVVVE